MGPVKRSAVEIRPAASKPIVLDPANQNEADPSEADEPIDTIPLNDSSSEVA